MKPYLVARVRHLGNIQELLNLNADLGYELLFIQQYTDTESDALHFMVVLRHTQAAPTA